MREGSPSVRIPQASVREGEPDLQAQIAVQVYALEVPDTACTQVLEPFNVDVPLGSYPTGHYFLMINGEQAAEFDA